MFNVKPKKQNQKIKMKNNKNFYRVGDTVNVKINSTPKIFTSVISQIRERLGKHNLGTTPMTPLVYFENGEVCDMGYITELVSRGKNVPYKPFNRFTPKSDWNYVSTRTKNKRVLCGTLRTLCILYLGKLNEEILTEISGNKLNQYKKSLTGVLNGSHGIIYVKKDHFEKWFKKNWKKILMTKKKYGQLETETNTQFEQDYWRSVEEEQIREMELM